MMYWKVIVLVVGVVMGSTEMASGLGGTDASGVTLHVEQTTEEGIDLLVVTATDNEGRPLEGLTVTAQIQRLFGQLVIGSELTYDDGTAYLELPKDLPPTRTGSLSILVTIVDPAVFADVGTVFTIGGLPVAGTDEAEYPRRALWASHAPLPLLGTLAVLLGGVWSTYVYVLYQVRCVRKGV